MAKKFTDEVESLNEKINSLFNDGEKEEKVIYGINQWMNVPLETLQTLETAINLMYEGFTLFDDCLDDSELRTGTPASHKIYGINRTIISNNAALMLSLNSLLTLNNLELVKIFVDENLRYFVGQVNEMRNQEVTKCLTIEEYFDIIRLKIQPGFYFLLRIIQLFSNCKTDFTNLSKLYAVYYQLLNDYSSIHGQGNCDIKGFCNDISEGKFTPTIIHAVNSGTHDGDVVFNIIRQKTKDVELKKYCLHLLNKLGSISYAKQLLLEAENNLREEMNKLGGNRKLHESIDLMNKWELGESVADNSGK